MPDLPDPFRTIPLAHRALHDRTRGRIENSPSAIWAALDAGYGIEIDLHLSSDGVPMVFHDDDLARLTDRTGPVEGETAETLGRTMLTGGTDTIPTLAAVLSMVAGKVPLLIELKDRSGAMSGTDERLEEAAARAIADYDGPLALMSFNPDTVAALARLAPSVPRGIVTSAFDPADWSDLPPETCDRLRGVPDYARTGASFVSHEAVDLSRPRVADLKAEGATVLCWTIRSPEAEVLARRIAHNVTFEAYAAAMP